MINKNQTNNIVNPRSGRYTPNPILYSQINFILNLISNKKMAMQLLHQLTHTHTVEYPYTYIYDLCYSSKWNC